MPALKLVDSVKVSKPLKKAITPKEQEEKPEETKQVVRLNDQLKKYRSPYSTDQILKHKENIVTEADSVDENKPATPFSQSQLDELWIPYVNKNIDSKNRSLYIALNQRTPELKDKFILEFPVENVVQKQQIETISLDLTGYLRDKLNNYSIVLKTPIKEVEKEKTYYSAEERYKYLAEKYPIIEKLRKNLDLDIDY